MASAQAINALKRFSTCDVGDALVKLSVPYGGYLHGLKMFSPEQQSGSTKIFGPAYTVHMVDAKSTTAPTLPGHFADTIPAESVVFVSQPKGFYSACWGGLMSTRAKYLGAAGVVVDGNVRDLGEHRGMGFPVFAKSTSCLGTATFTRCAAVNVPVEFTSPEQPDPFVIDPGDLIMADADGVVVIPPGKVEECVEVCEKRAKIDEQTFEALGRGEGMAETLKRLRK